tara:strand:- start:2851 stop:3441 length:591 start_codon:yes stop_codon:yes gene_type:complete
MNLHRTEIASLLKLKQSNTFNVVEVYNVGMNTIGIPKVFNLVRSGNPHDTHLETFRKDDSDIDAYDVWDNDDTVKCLSCQSPEAVDRGVKITKQRFLGKWVEATEHLAPLCSDCMTTKQSGSSGHVGVTMPPPSGYITNYIKDDTSYSRSAGHTRNPGITHKRAARCSAGSTGKYFRMGTVKITNTLTGKQSSFKL